MTMKKKIATLLLASSVVTLVALHPVSADNTNTGANTSKTENRFKEIRYVTYQGGKYVDIKESLKGEAASNTTPPKIDGYTYASGRDGKEVG